MLHISETRSRAEALRKDVVDAAIRNGAKIQRISSALAREEQETIAVKNSDGTLSIDTSIPKDMRALINKRYDIEELTFFGNRLVGARFSGAARQLTFRNSQKTSKSED